jgi:hypothetical protein
VGAFTWALGSVVATIAVIFAAPLHAVLLHS